MRDFYGKKYKWYIALPAILFILFIFLAFVSPGIPQGIDITGGTVIIVRSEQELSSAQIEQVIKEEFRLTELRVSTITSPTGYGAWIEYSNDPVAVEAEQLILQAENSLGAPEESIEFSNSALALLGREAQAFPNPKLALLEAQGALAEYKEAFSQRLQSVLSERLGLGDDVEFQKREVSPTLGATFYESGSLVAFWSVVFVVAIVFIFFRKVVPSVAIILAAALDILAAMAGMAVFSIPLSLASIPALMMLIGYSVDTDIMLTHRLLKRTSQSPERRAAESMKTGLTMTGTTLAALIAMLVVSYFYQIEVIYQIAAVLVFGLIGDLFSTWFMNAPILLWYVERKGGRA